jgi:hypothetical protein
MGKKKIQIIIKKMINLKSFNKLIFNIFTLVYLKKLFI